MSKKYKLNPDDYRAKLQAVQLLSIRLISSKINLAYDKLDEMYQTQGVDIVNQMKFDYKIYDNDTVYVFATNSMKAKSKKTVYFSMNFVHLLKFSGADSFDDDFFEIFKDNSLMTIINPYIREYVHSTTNRVGVPPLVLPLMKF